MGLYVLVTYRRAAGDLRPDVVVDIRAPLGEIQLMPQVRAVQLACRPKIELVMVAECSEPTDGVVSYALEEREASLRCPQQCGRYSHQLVPL